MKVATKTDNHSINHVFATTRLLTRVTPVIKNLPNAKFETMLFLPESKSRKDFGGLRTKGYFKKSLPDKPLITVVTVVLNRKKHLENTILSLINQTYDNVEYIIIDGGSSDGTLDIVKKYESQIDYWVSEKDDGLYDAMNKGLTVAIGDWVLLLNSDDKLLNNAILSVVSHKLLESGSSILHANMIVRYPNGRLRKNIPSEEENLLRTMCLNHGTCFVRRELYNVRRYNTIYSIAADYDFLLWVYLHSYKFEYINHEIIEYSAQGLTGSPNFGDLDSYKIWKSYFGKYVAMWFFLKDHAPKLVKVPIKKVLNKLNLY